MARKRASMREGPLAELFRATEAAQRQAEREGASKEPAEPHESTVEHVQSWEEERDRPREPAERTAEHVPEWEVPAEREDAPVPVPVAAVPDPEPEPAVVAAVPEPEVEPRRFEPAPAAAPAAPSRPRRLRVISSRCRSLRRASIASREPTRLRTWP